MRCSVLAASAAVLASLVVAPPALADAAPSTTHAGATSAGEEPVPPGGEVEGSTAVESPSPEMAGTTPTPTGPAPAPPEAADAAPSPTADQTSDAGTPDAGETVVGELVQAYPDPTAEEHEHDHEHESDHAEDGPLSWIDPGDGGEAVRVPTEALPDVAVGSTLAVTVGAEVADEASAEQGLAPAVEVQAATVLDAVGPDPSTASAGSAATNTVTAVMVLPAGATADGMSIGTVLSTLNGDVRSFWDEQSNGSVRITAVQGAAGWISSSYGCDKPFPLWADVARQIGWSQGAGKHLMLYVPANAPKCSYGLGEIGSSIGSGGRSYVQAAKLSVMGHELGHNFGLGHSSKLQCDSAVETGSCRTAAYADYYDIMGFSWAQVGTLNAVQASRLGLLPSSEQVAITTSSAATTVSLAPVSAASGTRAIRLTASDGSVYYVEYRQASGRDDWLADGRRENRAVSGVVVRRESSGDDTSLLLDGTPSPASGWASDMQQTLQVGQPTPVGSGQFTVTVAGTGTGSAEVQVVTPTGAGARLLPGSRLGSGQSIESADGFVRVVMQGDGNLVGYGSSGRVLWATYTYAPGASLTMQPDGNAVMYAPDGRVVWHAGTWGNPGSSMVVKPDGSTVVRAPDGRELWGTVANTPARLSAGQYLGAGQYLVSADGSVKVVMQGDGNLVGYGSSGRVLWATYTYAPGASLRMQPDGNAVMYAPDGRVVWHAGTWGNPGSSLVVKSDGSTVVRASAGRELWGTVGNTPARLSTGQVLTSYQYLSSSDGSVKVVMQPDGNLTSYGLGGRVLWATYTYAPGAHLVVQPDGNLVIYAPDGRAVWDAGTWGHPGTSLILKSDGSSVVSTPAGAELWGTNGS